MSLTAIIVAIIGLAAFETISSLDNAVINAEVLSTMKNQKAKKFFVTWGMFFAIFVVRGLLPFLIVYAANTDLGLVGAFRAIISSDTSASKAIEDSAPYLMLSGGMFLILLFAYWLFVEEKNFGLPHEPLFLKVGQIWFYAVTALLLLGIFLLTKSRFDAATALPMMLASTVGFAAFFVTNGFKENAEDAEAAMKSGASDMSDWAKVLFLEVIDLTFSIDGVVGAFAFTTSVPLILIGNGLGAIVVRQLTLGNVERIEHYAYLKNGAMYSIGLLSVVMILEAFGAHIPFWVSPLMTISCIAFHFWLSIRKNRLDAEMVSVSSITA